MKEMTCFLHAFKIIDLVACTSDILKVNIFKQRQRSTEDEIDKFRKVDTGL